MKIITIVSARPQFIKAAVLSRAIRDHNSRGGAAITEFFVHTGQHLDDNKCRGFLEELEIPRPDCNLGVANLSHRAMTGHMLEALDEILLKEKPDWVPAYGDRNSTCSAT